MKTGAIKHKTYLQRAQVNTPPEIIKWFWSLLKKRRKNLHAVVDIGAGDGRFALSGHFESYEGIEIDNSINKLPNLPKHATVRYGCVFDHTIINYDACIGNPPYVRHHDIDPVWRNNVLIRFKDKLDITLNMLSNLYIYFICLGIIITRPNGIVALIVPYEWVSRPSARALRDYISSQGWGVDVYRFRNEIFNDVLTTASLSIIDKSGTSGKWTYYEIDEQLNIYPKKLASGSNCSVLDYEQRTDIWALRGLSPGTQKVFTLTEGERLHNGLTRKDVICCVTSLKNVPRETKVLDKETFKKYFIDANRKCWLIRSDKDNKSLSKSLLSYLVAVPAEARSTSTCINREPWYAFKSHPVSKILYSSGFTHYGPKFLTNEIGAIALGSVHGIHTNKYIDLNNLVNYLERINFEKRVVAHAAALKKVEIGQMNSVLNKYNG